MIEAEIEQRLAGDPALRGLVGERIHPGEAPPGTAFPLLIWQRVATAPNATMKAGHNLPEATMQFEALASSKLDALAIAARLFDVLDGWTDNPPAVLFSAAFAGQFDTFDRESKIHRVSMDVTFLYRA